MVSLKKIRISCSNPALQPQIQPRNLKSCSGTSNVDLHPQIQSWSLRFSTSAPEPSPELTFLGKMQGLPTGNQHFRPKCMVSWRKNNISGSNPNLGHQIQPWSLRSSPTFSQCLILEQIHITKRNQIRHISSWAGQQRTPKRQAWNLAPSRRTILKQKTYC